MKYNLYPIRDKRFNSVQNGGFKIDSYLYNCTICPYPVEIFKIYDKENTVTFKP